MEAFGHEASIDNSSVLVESSLQVSCGSFINPNRKKKKGEKVDDLTLRVASAVESHRNGISQQRAT